MTAPLGGTAIARSSGRMASMSGVSALPWLRNVSTHSTGRKIGKHRRLADDLKARRGIGIGHRVALPAVRGRSICHRDLPRWEKLERGGAAIDERKRRAAAVQRRGRLLGHRTAKQRLVRPGLGRAASHPEQLSPSREEASRTRDQRGNSASGKHDHSPRCWGLLRMRGLPRAGIPRQ